MSEYDGMVFVGMPFGSGTDPVFQRQCDAVWQAIEEVCEEFNVDACRVDQYAGGHSIIKQVKRLIKDADYCIFDLTAERPNVYYELGWADGIGHPREDMILIARRGTQLHFDLQHRSIRFYTDTEDLREILRADLEAILPEADEDDPDEE